jgi:signal transduction histidine kinase
MMHNINAVGTLETPAQDQTIAMDSASALFEKPVNPVQNLPGNEDLLHIARLVTVGELSACFAHEVFNPLMLIRGHLRFIDEGLPDDHAMRINFEVIERASKRIEDMARRMLDFSRKRAVRNERYDVAELLADAMRFMQPYFQGLYTDVRVNVTPGLPQIEADRSQIIQALVNLLQNAAEAMASGETRNLTISVTRAADDIRIAIADTGNGIDRDVLPRIFTPFFTTKGERGTGLGLYITRRIVEEHSGRITVQTSPHGTTFVVSLPIHH